MVGENDAHSQPAREGEPSSSQDPGSIDYPNLPPLSPVSQFEYDDSQSLGVADDNSQRESDEEHTEIGAERQIPDSGSDRSTSDQFEESFESPGSHFGEPPESPGPIPDPYPHPPPFSHYTMSDSSITSALNKASEIKKLNGPDDWVEWNRKLRGHLRMVGLWKILTGETPAPVTATAEHTVWQLNQDRLASLLLLITGPSALSLVELNIDNTATEQYQVLKNTYNTTTITTYSTLYRQIFQCNIANHKSLKEYGEEIANARNKLKELKRPLDELAVTCAFLNGLDASYQAWKDMFLGGYAKNPTTVQNGQEVMVVPTLEEILKLLIDREAGTSQTAANQNSSKTRAFRAKGNKDSSRPQARGGNSTSDKKLHCTSCLSNRHEAANCWYVHPDKRQEWFKKKYPDDEAVKKALEEVRKANKEWQKTHPNKGLIATAKISATGNKDPAWYLDSAAGAHATYDLKDYVYPDLDDSREIIETANGDLLRTRGAGTVAIEIVIDSIPSYVHLENVHYCPEMDSNLLSLGALEAKGFEFKAKDGFLNVKDTVGEVVLQSKREGTVYPLLQPQDAADCYVPATVHAYKATRPQTFELWHQRAGHVNYNDLIRLKNMAKGVAFKDTHTSFCEPCTLGKQHKVHSKEPATHRAAQSGERLHNDLYGGGSTLPGVGGYQYGSVVVDDATRMRFPIVLKTKDQICDELPIVIKQIEVHTGRPVKSIRTDDGPEFARLHAFLNEKGIFREKSAPYAQDQDGVSERSIRTVLERARIMMIHANLPRHLWPEAIATAVYITNRLPTKALNNKTPYESWYGHQPDLSNLRVYGCDAYVVDYEAKSKGKMAPRSWAGTLVGYEAKNQWRIFDGKKVFVRRDVIFNESSLTYQKEAPKENSSTDIQRDVFDLADLTLEPVGAPTSLENSLAEQRLDNALDTINTVFEDTISSDTSNSTEVTSTATDQEVSDQNPLIIDHPRRKVRHDYNKLNTRGFAKIAKPVPHHNIVTPKTYEEAINGPQKEQWLAALKEEVLSQLKRGTFRITKAPYDEKVIDGKWTFKIKENPDGTIARYKARWVAKGFVQVAGRDYDKKFAPVVRSDTSRILLSIAATRGWQIRQFDIKTAFLNSQMDRKIYTAEPKGFETGDDNACLLNTALYGLVQSAYLWFEEIKGTLIAYGLIQSKHDDALFFDTKSELYVTVYMDDIKAFAPTNDVIDKVSNHLSAKYELTDLGDVKWYLGMEISRLEDGSILLTQSKYIRDILHKHGMENCSSVSTPMTQTPLEKAPNDYKADKELILEYSSLLGELMHLMVQTRPDLAQSVSKLAEYMSNPTDTHWLALKHLLRYLQGTQDLGICYRKAQGNLSMSIWTDSSWADDLNDSKSRSGYVVLIGGGPVAWKSTKQQSVALSSTEAEYMGQTMAATQAMWIRGLLKELKIEGVTPEEATVIYADNQGAIKLAENPIFQRRSKHIAVRYHYTRDLIQQEEIKLEYKSTKDMIADGLTKPLGRVAFQKFVELLGLTSVKAATSAVNRTEETGRTGEL